MQAHLFTGAEATHHAAGMPRTAHDFASGPVPVLHPPDWSALSTDVPFTLELGLDPEAIPLPGSLLRVEVGAEQLWFLVQEHWQQCSARLTAWAEREP